MSKPRRDRDFLLDIEEVIERILSYTVDMTWDNYLLDRKTQDAVVKNLEVIGEATKNLSEGLRGAHPEVPWREMAGTRDRLMHHYFGINQEIVWQIVEFDLPDLKSKISEVINKTPSGSV